MNTGNPALRWRRVFIALMLALSMESVGQTLPAQAGPAHDQVTVSMDIVSPKTTICVGESAFYEVQVNTAPTTNAGYKLDAYALPGITVTAFSQYPDVGDIVGPNKKGISTRRTGSWEELDTLGANAAGYDDNPARPNSAVFPFKAKKAGRTTLFFDGLAYGQYVSFNVPVKVIVCKYEVNTNSAWVLSVQGGTGFFFEFMKTLMTGGEGGSFTISGSPTVLWIGTEIVPNFGSTVTINKGSAKLRGQIDKNDQLALNIAFDPVTSTDKICAPPPLGCGGGTYTITSDPLTFPPIPQTGGSGTVWHAIDAAGVKVPGHTTVTVKPLDAAK